MTKAFKFFLLAACCGALSVVCFEWARAIAGESPDSEGWWLFPAIACVACSIGGLVCSIEAAARIGIDDDR